MGEQDAAGQGGGAAESHFRTFELSPRGDMEGKKRVLFAANQVNINKRHKRLSPHEDIKGGSENI